MDITLVCPDCGGSVMHQCMAQRGAISNATPDAMLAQPSSQARIAHGSSSRPSTKRTPYNQGYEPGFLEFWNIYPLKRDKRKAQRAWRNAIHRATAQIILQGARRYREDPNRLAQFTKYAEGWLNGDCWEDEPLPPRLRPGMLPTAPVRHQDDIDAEVEAYIEGRS